MSTSEVQPIRYGASREERGLGATERNGESIFKQHKAMSFISYLSVAPEAGVRVGVIGLVDGLLPELVLAACNFELLNIYKVTHANGKNLPLTWFGQFRQLVGHYCSYLLPRQDGVTCQI